MTTIINHDLRVVNGGTLYMPPWEEGNDKWGNLELPDVYAIGTSQLYPTGTIYRKGMRTFIYTLTDALYHGSGGVGVGAGYLMESAAEMEDLRDAVISGAAGANKIVVNMGAACVKNAYAGGFIGIIGQSAGITTVGGYMEYQIISNTVQDGSTYVTFTIDGTLPIALALGDHAVLTEHPYAMIRHPQKDLIYGGCVGVLLCTTVASSYLWLQTGGPHNLVHCGNTFEGQHGFHSPVYDCNGVANCSDITNTTPDGVHDASNLQIIGFSFPSSWIGGYGAGSGVDNTVAIGVFLTIFN